MLTIESAITIAALAHKDQLDKAGQPYIYHPLRVMLACKSETTRVVAVLHDVIEDTTWSIDEMATYFRDRPDIIEALTALTRAEGETYVEYIHRVGDNPIATSVKLQDLRDNMDPSRQAGEGYISRLSRYERAMLYLLTMPKFEATV